MGNLKLKKIEKLIKGSSYKLVKAYIKAEDGYFLCDIYKACNALYERYSPIPKSSILREYNDFSDIPVRALAVGYFNGNLAGFDIRELNRDFPCIPWEEAFIKNPDNPFSVLTTEQLKEIVKF